jgi:hypothetical protein
VACWITFQRETRQFRDSVRAQQSTEVVSAAQEQIPQRKALRNDKLSGLGMTVARESRAQSEIAASLRQS